MYANNFGEIQSALATNVRLRSAMMSLVTTDRISGKALEGGTRIDIFRDVIGKLVSGHHTLRTAVEDIERRLPRGTSPFVSDNRVFADGWAERLVRTQLSRFYNQAVLEECISDGVENVFVPHSPDEDSQSRCSQSLAGASHSARALHAQLVGAYRDGNWTKVVRIPDHPHCTHVVVPARS